MTTNRDFCFDKDQFNKLFPFHILFDSKYRIVTYGQSISKVCPIQSGMLFSDLFYFKRPELDASTLSLLSIVDQIVIIGSTSNKNLTLRGQFELTSDHLVLFVGTPWFSSIEEMIENNLSIKDFAVHDSTIDLLHVLKAQEITTGEIKQLFNKVNDQKNIQKNQEKKYRSIIENMNLGLIEVNTLDEIQYANQNFCKISGYSLNELINKKAHELLLESKSAEIIHEKSELRKKGISDSYEIAVRTKQGETRWWLISGAPNYNEFGELIGSTGIHLDITRQKRLEKALRVAKSKAEESSKAKEDFLANMSHEIRTPLNAIIGMVRELNRTCPTPQQQVYLKHTESASQHLLSIINDILDISKIEAGQLHLDRQNFSLQTVLQETRAIMESSANDKMLNLQFEVHQEIAPALIGDPNRIRQILLNLISNSIKFTEKGSVVLKCQSNHRNDDSEQIQFDVIDTGIGMEKSFLKSLFKKFTQEDISTVRKYGGTGLGMAITSELIHLMGGTIEVNSEKGVGSHFKILIPLGVGNKSELELNVSKGDSGKLSKLRALLVEDNELNRLVAINSLLYNDVEVTEAVNGLEAVEILKTTSFDIILMDMQMPVMGGLEATKIIRTDLKLDVPIIALTANAFKNEIEKCLAVGMNDFVTKPFDEAVFISVINKNVRTKVEAVHKNDEKQPTISNDSCKLYDLSQIIKLSRDNTDFVREIVTLFCKLAPSSVEIIRKSFESGDYTTLKATAHKIKPMIDNLNIASLKVDIRSLESFDVEKIASLEVKAIIEKLESTLLNVVTTLKLEYQM